jgi:predicted RNase H-like HicB family nuclease
MSAKSKKSSKAIDRPFTTDVLRRARDLASKYQVILRHEDGEYYGRGLELPLVMSDGKTPDACVKNTRDAFVAAIATMLELNRTPPSPADEGTRSEQVNVRLTPEEKILLEEAARMKGFRGISDFVRSASLATIR